MMERNVQIESPSEIVTGEGTLPSSWAQPQETAAGIPAVISTMKFVKAGPGLVKGVKTLLKANQDGGVDCPSCAWPDPEGHRSPFEFCENGAKALADETTKKVLDAHFFQQHSVEDLSDQSDYWLNRQGRLTEPLYLGPDQLHYRPISWDDAFDKIAEVVADSSPDRLAFYTSGRASNEAAFLYGTLARMLGTNNLPDCSNMCHESSGSALGKTIGIGKGTVTLDDFERTDLILVVGQNPGTNHPRMLSALQAAKENNTHIVSINPLAEAGLSKFKNPQDYLNPVKALKGATPLGDNHLPVRVGGDLALFKGLAKCLVEWDSVDQEFVDAHTVGFHALREDVEAESWEKIVESSGISETDIRALATKVSETNKIIICWAMGVTQHTNSVDTITQMVNILLMRGAIGKPGAGVCPVRGHSNVQGDRTVGITHKPKTAFLEALQTEFGFEPPDSHGFDVCSAIEAMDRGEVDLFFSLGGNFLSATPDTYKTASGLQKCKLTVSVVTKLNRSHLVTGQEALILPCLGRTELDLQDQNPQFVTVENSMGKVHRSKGVLHPASPHLRSEVAIICGLAQAACPDSAADWDKYRRDYGKVREAIERVIPGFEEYNTRLQQYGGFYLPNGPREGRFTTPDEKAHFTVAPIVFDEVASDELILMTLRSHDQFNTVIYGYDDRYRGIYRSRRVVFANAGDLARLGFKPGDVVSISSEYEGKLRQVKDFTLVAYPIPEGCCAAYFPEANPLVPVELRDPVSGCPASKKIIVKLSGPGKL